MNHPGQMIYIYVPPQKSIEIMGKALYENESRGFFSGGKKSVTLDLSLGFVQ